VIARLALFFFFFASSARFTVDCSAMKEKVMKWIEAADKAKREDKI
jgi:hypothetical protein